MDAIYYIISIIGVVMVIYWAAGNDAAGNRGRTSGLFAMREPEDEVKAKGKPLPYRPLPNRPLPNQPPPTQRRFG